MGISGAAIAFPEMSQAKEIVMKRSCTAVLLVVSLLLISGCSSIPSGTDAIRDLQKKGKDAIGQNVIVVGMADTKTPLSSFRAIKIYQDQDFIWVALPQGVEEPPQGLNVRVTGTIQEREFPVVGKVLCVEATKIMME